MFLPTSSKPPMLLISILSTMHQTEGVYKSFIFGFQGVQPLIIRRISPRLTDLYPKNLNYTPFILIPWQATSYYLALQESGSWFSLVSIFSTERCLFSKKKQRNAEKDGQPKMKIILRKGQRPILAINLVMILIFSIIFIMRQNWEFILYRSEEH